MKAPSINPLAILALLVATALSPGCSEPTDSEAQTAQAEEADDDAVVLDSWLTRLGANSLSDIAAAPSDREEIDIGGTDVADDDLAHLVQWTNVRHLDISGTYLSDAAIPHILAFKSLEELDIVFTQISGKGLRQLGTHPSLQSIDLWHDQLDEDGLAGLKAMPQLRHVYLWLPDFSSRDKELSKKICLLRPDVKVEVERYVDPGDAS